MRRAARLLLSASCLLGLSMGAGAAEVSRVDVQGATGMCKAATNAYAVGTRYRPLALANESDANSYVTCNWQGDDKTGSVRGAKRLSLVVSNYGNAARSVTCTLVNGHQTGALVFASYVPKTVNIPAGGFAEMAWVPGEVANSKPSGIDRPSVSCALPPQTALQYTRREYNEDVGA
jgi:hypothetical protein